MNLKDLAGKTITLTDDERTAWKLVHQQGMEHGAAAAVVNVRRETFTRRVCRARNKIRLLKLLIAETGGNMGDVDRLTGLSRDEGQK